MKKYTLINKNGGFEPITKEEYQRWTKDPGTAVGKGGPSTDLGDRLDRQTHGRGYLFSDFTVVVSDEEAPAKHVAGWTKIDSQIVVGTAGLLGVDRPEGYFCTICASLAGNAIKFQDLHITKEHAEQIIRQLQQQIEWSGDDAKH